MAQVPKLKRTAKSLSDVKSDLVVIGIHEGKGLTADCKALDKRLKKKVMDAITLEKFKGEFGKHIFLYGDEDVKRVLIYGLGKADKYDGDAARKLGAIILRNANALKVKSVTVDAESLGFSGEQMLQAGTEGLMITNYEFLDYKSKKEETVFVKTIYVLGNAPADMLKKVQALTEGVFLARDVSNHPANVATPTYLANHAREIGKAPNTTTKIFDLKEIEKMGMGAFYGVARGATEPAKMIIIDYKGGKKGDKPFALVGKGLTFDSGGISIKPSAGMDEMKFDMCGSSTVLGVMKAVSILQPKINIVAAIGSTENMPDGNAQRPGDIVTAYNGKTIEILNTDAEGRLVLADVMSYVVDKYKPVKMIDFATLTGAVVVALGDKVTGIMSNNAEFVKEIKAASEVSGEKVWELPLWDSYFDDIKSKIADIKNVGNGRMAGTITAGMFLKEFVGDTTWCHMDIAGTAWGATKPEFLPKVGASGVAVRLVYNLLENQK